ncbi:MAG: S-layer homology domain-containing protein [Clostridia bacterium]
MNWIVIGSAEIFSGDFDGQGHTVSGVYINDPSAIRQGLFGYIDNATVKNVGIVDSSINAKSNVGAVVGYASGGSKVENCYNTSDVFGNYVGGIAGSLSSGSTIEKCYNTGTVSGGSGADSAGGIVSSSGGTVKNCYNTGTVSGATNSGGIVGDGSGSVEYCYNIGTVTDGQPIASSTNTTVTSSYYNSEQFTGTYDGTPLTTAQMTGFRASNNMSGFGSDVWVFTADGDIGQGSTTVYYPTLKDNLQSPAPSGYTSDLSTWASWEVAADKAVQDTDYVLDDTGKTITIYTAYGMAWFADKVNSESYNSYTVDLANDIDLRAANVEGYNETTIIASDYIGDNSWTAIGSNGNSTAFKGTFNGNGHTVSGVYINISSGYQGLFGNVSDATIKNITVSGSISGGQYVGGIVGRADSSTIFNATNLATVVSTYNDTGNAMVGGIVGRLMISGTVINCANFGDVTATDGKYVGGVVGELNVSTITNSYNAGKVTGKEAVGGVVGFEEQPSASTIQQCYNVGDVIGTTNVGGVVGYIYNTNLTDVYNAGTVSGTTNGTTNVGGIVGKVEGNNSITNGYYNEGTASTAVGYGTSYSGTPIALTLDKMTGTTEDGNEMTFTSENWTYTANVPSSDSTIYYYPIIISNAQDPVPSETKKTAFVYVDLEDWTYGEEPNAPETIIISDQELIAITYYTDENCENSMDAPTETTDAGTYYVKAYIAGTEEYTSATSVSSFTIEKCVPTFTATIDESAIYGEFANISVTATAVGTLEISDSVTFYTTNGEQTVDLGYSSVVINDDSTSTANLKFDTKVLPIGTSYIYVKYTASNKNVATTTSSSLGGFTLTPKPITASVVGEITKEYDGTNTASVELYIESAYLVNSTDDISITATATYATVDVADGIAISFTDEGIVSGARSDYYSVSLPENVTGSITKTEYEDNTQFTSNAKYGNTASVDMSAWATMTGTSLGDIYVIDSDTVLVAGSYEISNDTMYFETINDVNNVGKTATLIVPVYTQNYFDFALEFIINITAKDVPVLTVEDISKIYNGQAITDEEIVGTAKVDDVEIDGTWAFEGDTLKNVSDTGSHTVIFTPEDTSMYSENSTSINIYITPYEITLSVDDLSAYENDTEPTYTYTQSSELFEGDSWITEPTIHNSAVDMSTEGTYTLTISADAGENYSIITEDGTLTIATEDSEEPDDSDDSDDSNGSGSSSSSSSSTTTTTTTTTNDDGSVTSTTASTSTTSGTTVTVTVSDEDMQTAIENAMESDQGNGVYVEIAVTTKSDSDTVEATFSADVAQTLANSDVDALVVTSDLAKITIPSGALSSIASQVDGGDITIVVEHVDVNALTDAQQIIIGDNLVVDLTVTSGDKIISSFGTHEIIVTLPYELKDGEDAENIVVWYVADDGAITVLHTVYSVETGTATFVTDHFSVYTVVHDINQFTDVEPNAYYYNAVIWAIENAITKGVSDTTFGSETNCTRAQAVTLLWKAYGSPVVNFINPFTDVDADSYYYEAVLWAVSEGITSGTSDTMFSPEEECTRGQIVTFLYRASGETTVVTDTAFTDVDADSYCYEAVLWAVSEGITNGTSDTTFSPDEECTRGQIVTLLYRNMAE